MTQTGANMTTGLIWETYVEWKNCERCRKAEAHCNSDATTAGFFRPYCSQHAPLFEMATAPRHD